jgi:hypothetical protein
LNLISGLGRYALAPAGINQLAYQLIQHCFLIPLLPEKENIGFISSTKRCKIIRVGTIIL